MKITRKLTGILIIGAAVAVLIAVVAPAKPAAAINPTTINFQGKVVKADGTNVTDGTYPFTFKLYSAASGGAAIWSETQASVTVVSGVFQVNLGGTCSLFLTQTCGVFSNTAIDFNANPALYLGITFNSDAAGEMTPRPQLQSVPFAFNADKVGGLSASQLAQLSGTQQTGAINVTGAGTFGANLSVGGVAANSTAALDVKNLAGADILKVDSTANNNNNLLTNPSIESAIAGNWALHGAAAVAQDASQKFSGNNSLALNITGTNGGAQQSVALVTGTSYSFAINARLSNTTNINSLEIGYSNDGVTDVACQTGQAVLRSGWSRISCAFTTGTVSGSPYIYVKQTDATARTIYIDAATLELVANTTTNYHEGSISLQANITSPVVIQNASNTMGALQVLSSKGANVFSVDTIDGNLLAGSAGFETNGSGYSYSGTPGSILRDSSVAYTGTYSMKVTTTANANNGLKFTFANASPAIPLLAINTTYTISWYDQITSGSFTDVIAAYARDGATEVNCAGINTQIVSIGGWTRHSCQIVTDATAPAASAYLVIKQTAATAHVFNVDSVQLELGTNATGYGAGAVTFNATINSPVNIRELSNSTTSFQIQNAAGFNVFNVDTLATRLNVTAQEMNNQNGSALTLTGTPVSDGTVSQLQLGNPLVGGNAVANGGTYFGINTPASGPGSVADLINLQTAGVSQFKIDAGGSIVSNGSFTGGYVTSNVTDTTGTTFAVATPGSAYFLKVDSLTTSASFTSTTNITGLPAIDGTIATISATCAKGITGANRTHTCLFQVAGSTLSTIATATTTTASSNTRTLVVTRFAGVWTVVGSGLAATPTVASSTVNTADYAEFIRYSGVSQPRPGDVLVVGDDPTSVKLSSREYQSTIIGVVSTSPFQTGSADDGHSVVMALNGRVPLNVNLENGPIRKGDKLTASSTLGQAMKASRAGRIIGIALEDYDGADPHQVTVQLSVGYDDPTAGTPVISSSLLTSGVLHLDAGSAQDISLDPSSAYTARADASTNQQVPVVVAGSLTIDQIASMTTAKSLTPVTEPKSTADQNSVTSIKTEVGLNIVDSTGRALFTIDTAGNGTLSGSLNLASASISGGLSVGGDLNIAGLSTFQKLATFMAKTIFRQDVQFDGHITVAADSAGYALLRTADTTVHVSFNNPYDTAPVVSVSTTDGQFVPTSVAHITRDGFDVTLATAASQDLKLSWTAVGVQDPLTASNPAP